MNDIEKAFSNINYGLQYENCGEMVIITKFSAGLAISALEKQVSKKPIYHEQTEKYYEYHECPNCEDIFDASTTSLRYKYCPECGQLLDWSVEE